jgi:hypothetical protein
VPVAVKGWVVPSGIAGIAGVTAMETRTAGVTVRVVEPLIEPEVAVTLVLPNPTLLNTPCELTVATPEFVVLQVTEFVRSSVLPSVYVPVAFKACVVPSANEEFAGVMTRETKVGCVTVTVVEPVMDAEAPVTVAVPTLPPVARAVLLILTMAGAEELQLTELVTSCVLPSV